MTCRTCPGLIQVPSVCLEIWSSAITTRNTIAARTAARRRAASVATDQIDDDPADDAEHDQRQHRAEVDAPERGDDAPEDPQVGLADVPKKLHYGVKRPRVRWAGAERQDQVREY